MGRNSRVAIVGDGVGALITLGVLQMAGVSAETIAIYGTSPHPLATLQHRMSCIAQQQMRSEGTSHLAPRDFPGLVWHEASQQHKPWLLLMALFDAYTPSVPVLLEHAAQLADRLNFERCRVPSKVGMLQREGRFLRILADDEAEIGRTEHVILAIGHGGLHQPFIGMPHVTHAYEARDIRPNDHILVVGGGMAAAHCQHRALAARATVTALTRRPVQYQPLNAPREQFTTPAIARYQNLTPDQRLETLATLQLGSIRRHAYQTTALRKARREGRLQLQIGSIQSILPTSDGLCVQLTDGSQIHANRLICATGFDANPCAHPLVARLIHKQSVSLIHGFLTVANDFTLTPLSRQDSIVGVIGSLARFALPVADTFAGLKYAARRLVARIMSAT